MNPPEKPVCHKPTQINTIGKYIFLEFGPFPVTTRVGQVHVVDTENAINILQSKRQ